MSRFLKNAMVGDGHVTPKSKVLSKFPKAVARRVDSASSFNKNHWRVWTHDGKGAKPLGSSGTTATAWSTAARDMYREERRATREAAEKASVESMAEAFGADHLLRLFRVIKNRNTQHLSVDEILDYLEAR